VRKTIIIYGVSMAVLVGALKFVEYRFIVRDIPLEFYIGTVAVMFAAVGVWAGLRLTRPKIIREIVDGGRPFQIDEANLKMLGISKREY